MPSVQWGASTSAHLTFTPLGSALGALSNGAGTIAILWKPVKNVSRADGAQLLSSTEATAYAGLCLGDGGTGQWADDNGTSWVVSTSTPAFGDWYISVVDWPATAAKARFHWKDLSTAGAWSHEDSVANGVAAFAGPGATGHWNIGYDGDGGGSGMQIALVGAWNVRLGDANAALLSTNSRTSDWAASPAGAPVFLSEITSLTPTDLIGASTFSAGSSLTTNLTVGGAPAGGWTFDGLGADTPTGAVTFGARRVESSTRADAPRGAVTLAGRVAEAWSTRTHRDTPVGTISLAGGGAVSQPIVRPGVVQAPGRPRTGMPGTPGLVQPGYFCTGVAIWRGPFDTEIAFGFTPGAVPSVERGQQLAIAPNVASQFAAADATWWEFH